VVDARGVAACSVLINWLRWLSEHAYSVGRFLSAKIVPLQHTGQPIPGDRGAHGIFDDWALASSLQLWANTNRLWFAVAGAATAACAALLTRK